MSEKTFRWGIIGLGGIANAFADFYRTINLWPWAPALLKKRKTSHKSTEPKRLTDPIARWRKTLRSMQSISQLPIRSTKSPQFSV
jgi:hypothetical protein